MPPGNNMPLTNHRPSNIKQPCGEKPCGNIPPEATRLNTPQNYYSNPSYDHDPPDRYKSPVFNSPYGKEPPWLYKILNEQAYKPHEELHKPLDKNKPPYDYQPLQNTNPFGKKPCDEETTTDSKYTVVKKIMGQSSIISKKKASI